MKNIVVFDFHLLKKTLSLDLGSAEKQPEIGLTHQKAGDEARGRNKIGIPADLADTASTSLPSSAERADQLRVALQP